MNILQITTSWPEYNDDISGNFIYNQTESLKENGIIIHTYYFKSKKNPFRYLMGWIKVRALLHSFSYDLVFCQFGQSAFIVYPTSLPVVVNLHGSDVLGLPNKDGKYSLLGFLYIYLVKKVSYNAKAINFVSNQLSTFYNTYKGKKSVIPVGVNLNIFKPVSRSYAKKILKLSDKKKYIFFPNNPNRPVKNYQLALDSFNLLQMNDVEILVGKDIPPSLMNLYYNASSLVLLTSFHEGSPNVIKEALACNIPIVSVPVGDVTERIDKIEGCFIVPYDKYEICERMKYILNNNLLINGREKVELISEKNVANNLIQLFRSVMKN